MRLCDRNDQRFGESLALEITLLGRMVEFSQEVEWKWQMKQCNAE